jgi:hypothetical protein
MDNAIQAIGRRRWDIISERWRSYLPDILDDMPNAYQAPTKNDIFVDRMKGLASSDQFDEVADAPILRTLIFEASRFCTERCLYFTRTAEQLVSQGTPTAAITTSYLAMMFGSRSMQSLLGLYYCFEANSTWLVDVWPGASDTTSQGRLKEWVPRIVALIDERRIGHEHHWKLFIRLRAVATRLPLDDEAMAALRRLRDHGNFSNHRNRIHYNDYWPYRDLYQQLNDAEIGILPAGWNVDEEQLDHSLKIAQVMAFCSARMVLDVLSPLRKFREYCTQLKLRLGSDWHPLMNAGALSTELDQLRRLA